MNHNAIMALSLYQLEPLLREGITTINNVRSLDFKALTLKDIVTLVGLVYTAGKSVAIAWQLWKAVRQHGLSKVMRPNLKRKYGEWAGRYRCQSVRLLTSDLFSIEWNSIGLGGPTHGKVIIDCAQNSSRNAGCFKRVLRLHLQEVLDIIEIQDSTIVLGELFS